MEYLRFMICSLALHFLVNPDFRAFDGKANRI